MTTIKAIAVSLLSMMTMSYAQAQTIIVKEKSGYPYYKEPKTKLKDKDGIPVMKTKNYGGYRTNKLYFDNSRQCYYYWDGSRRVYYNRNWRP